MATTYESKCDWDNPLEPGSYIAEGHVGQGIAGVEKDEKFESLVGPRGPDRPDQVDEDEQSGGGNGEDNVNALASFFVRQRPDDVADNGSGIVLSTMLGLPPSGGAGSHNAMPWDGREVNDMRDTTTQQQQSGLQLSCEPSRVDHQDEPHASTMPGVLQGVLEDRAAEPRTGSSYAGHAGQNTTAGATAASRDEQQSLRQDIMNLMYQGDRETTTALANVVSSPGTREVSGGSNSKAGSNLGRYDIIAPPKSPALSLDMREDGQTQPSDLDTTVTMGSGLVSNEHWADVRLASPSRPARRRLEVNSANVRQVEVAGQAVTALSLAAAFEATMDLPGTCPISTSQSNTGVRAGHQDLQRMPLWSLAIHRCQVSSLLPVAGLLHHLDRMCSLEIDGCAGLAPAGLDRVLADAPRLRTLTIRRCGLSQLPRLQSGSVEVLDLSFNAITDAAGLETLFRLKVLNLAGNNLSRLADIRPLVPLGIESLRELNLVGNPIQQVPRYRTSVVAMTPSVRLLDGVDVPRLWRDRTQAKAKKLVNWVGDRCLSYSRAATSLSECGRDPTLGSSEFFTPSRTRDRTAGGYFSDGAASVRRGAARGAMTPGGGGVVPTSLDTKDGGEYVQGLAGLGLIWAGTSRARRSPFRGSASMPSSPAKTHSPGRGQVFLSRSNPSDGVYGGLGMSRRRRPPSPERCRQVQADTVRSIPRANWGNKFLRHQQQELLARNRAKERREGLSRGRQVASMDRLAQPVRLFPQRQGDGSRSTLHRNTGVARTLAEEGASEEWNVAFTHAVLAESVGLVDRPTALKGPDGRWEGIMKTGKGERKAALPVAEGTEPRSNSASRRKPVGDTTVTTADSQAGGEKYSFLHHHLSSLRGSPRSSITPSCLSDPPAENQAAEKHGQRSPLPVPGPNTHGAVTSPQATRAPPPIQPLVNPAPMARTLSPSLSPTAATSPMPDSPRAPTRVTLTLPDAWTSKNRPLGSSRAGGGKSGSSCSGQSAGGGGSSSPRSATGRRGGGSRGERGAGSCRPARGFRVLKTSRDFAETVLRVYKVELEEHDAKSLYQQLDFDRDGALGAEDLLRGAPVIASFVENRRHPDTQEGGRRQGGQAAASAERALSRSAARNTQSRIREETRRETRRRALPTEWQADHHRRPQHDGFATRTRDRESADNASFDEEIPSRSLGMAATERAPRRLEDWRVPDCGVSSRSTYSESAGDRFLSRGWERRDREALNRDQGGGDHDNRVPVSGVDYGRRGVNGMDTMIGSSQGWRESQRQGGRRAGSALHRAQAGI